MGAICVKCRFHRIGGYGTHMCDALAYKKFEFDYVRGEYVQLDPTNGGMSFCYKMNKNGECKEFVGIEKGRGEHE